MMEPLQPRWLLADTQLLWIDDFNGSSISASRWELPAAGAESQLGRTELRSASSGNLPTVANGFMRLRLDTFNPNDPGGTFYGAQINTKEAFNSGSGLLVEMGARVIGPVVPGAIFGFSLFDPTGADQDEIDIQIPTNKIGPGADQVLTNVFAQQPNGPGDAKLHDVPGDDLTNFHIFRIEWYPGEIHYYVDAEPVRVEMGKSIPGPLSLYINAWVPGADFTEAYDAGLTPAANAGANQSMFLEVDYVSVSRVGVEWVVQEGRNLTINGTSGNDSIILGVQASDLTINRNGETTTVPLSSFDNIIVEGFAGNDRITAGNEVPAVYMNGGAGDDTLTGGNGNDSLTGAAGRDRLIGGAGFDRLDGGKHADQLFGGDGNDRLYGGDGADFIDAGTGRDRAYGGPESDTILGGNHNDTLYGDEGNDSIDGGNHNDRIFAGPGADTVIGGKGNDIFYGNRDGFIDNLNGGPGTDGAEADDNDVITLIENLL